MVKGKTTDKLTRGFHVSDSKKKSVFIFGNYCLNAKVTVG